MAIRFREEAGVRYRAMSELDELLGASPAVESLKANIRRLLSGVGGRNRLPAVFLTGETGTGKGLVANLLHHHGPRAGRPFVQVNCAAIPENLLESELFGFERGAFTGAQHAKPGLFQAAHTGTIFLDEVGLLAEPLQAKLLKVIEERAVRRLGGTRSEPVDVWVISATNSDLQAAIRERHFREDLYHRLSVVPLSLPPLRARGKDILLLAEHFLTRVCADYGLPRVTLSEDARECLMAHPWHGNVRELANVIERAALMCESSRITAALLDLKSEPVPLPASAALPGPPASEGARSLDAVVRDHLQSVLDQYGGNISRTAAVLGVARNTLRSQIRKLGVTSAGRHAVRGAGANLMTPPREADTGLSGAATAEVPVAEPVTRPAPPPPPAGGEVVRWERRRVTILRVAVFDSESTDDLTPASNVLLASAVEKIRSFGGRIEDVGPSEVEASFGVEPIEDAARCAALAALAIRMSIARTQGTSVARADARVLIHTGTVRIGHAAGTARIDLESKRRMTRSIDALSSVGAEAPIIVTAPTAAFLGRQFMLEPVDGARERGETCYRLIGHKMGEQGGTGLDPFVGRRAELGILHARVGDALAGRGQVVALVGAAGVGKSRLLREFAHSAAARPFRLLETGTTRTGIGPYRTVAELLRRFFQVHSDDDMDLIRERVLATLSASERGAASLLPAFLSLLEVPSVDPEWNGLEPAARRERTLEAFKRLILSESSVQPVLLLFEDLHWVDTESQALLHLAVQSLPAARVLVLVSYRPQYRHEWGNLSYYTQLRIDPLPAGEATELLDHVLGGDSSLGPLKRRLVDWTEGNPFFLEESVRALEETGTLEGSPGAYKLVRPVGAIEVPVTVEDVLAARFDRLEPGDRKVLEAAAAIGRNVPFALLAAIAESPGDELLGALRRLQEAEVLCERSDSLELEFTFKHVLTHEVAYRTQLPEVRRHLHTRIFHALEAGAKEPAREQLDSLAHHAFHGELWDRAVEYLRRAGRRALFASANGEAVEIFEQALLALGHLPETPATLEQALALRLTLRDALWSLGQIGRIRDQLVEADAIAHQIGDQRALGRVACFLCHYSWAVGELEAALEAGERALAIAGLVGDGMLLAETELYRGIVFIAQGDDERATQVLQRAQVELDRLIADKPGTSNRANALWLLVRCFMTRVLAEQGRFEDGIAGGEEALALAQRSGTAFGLVTALAGLGSLYLRKAEPETAIPQLERGLELCRTFRVNNWLPTIAASLGSAYALTGRVDEGVRLLDEAVHLARTMGIVATASLWSIYRAEAYLGAGRVPEALEESRRILSECRARGEQGYQAWVLYLLGRCLEGQQPPDSEEARASYLLALELAERLGMQPLVVRSVLSLARLHERAGDLTPASVYRARGGRLASELGMSLALLESA